MINCSDDEIYGLVYILFKKYPLKNNEFLFQKIMFLIVKNFSQDMILFIDNLQIEDKILNKIKLLYKTVSYINLYEFIKNTKFRKNIIYTKYYDS